MTMFTSAIQRGGITLLCLVLPSAAVRAQAGASAASSAAPAAQTLTLDGAISLATANEPALAAAQADMLSAKLDRTNARVAMLPTATYHNQALYTKSNGVAASRIGQTADSASPAFIANNAVREY